MSSELPAEIWTHIFDLAADEDILFQYGIPTIMAESAWYKDNLFDKWRLRAPGEAMNLLQRRSYATKKAIMSTCHQWRTLGAEFLFRCLHFSDPKKLKDLSNILQSSSAEASTRTASIGWWTRRIHIARYHKKLSLSELAQAEDALVNIIQHCPNLEIFIIENQMGTSFGPIADALANHAYRKLHTVQWNLPGEELAKVIWALNSLPRIVAAHIDIETPVESSQELAHLGSASNIHLMLPSLQQLSLCGYVEEFLEQATGWDLPALQSVSIDSGISVNDVPDVIEFLRVHGGDLVLLDLNLGPLIDIATALDLCPCLSTLTFNADWPVPPRDAFSSEIAKRPHDNITTIGLHGLSYGFGVGHAAPIFEVNPVSAGLIARSNERNVAALNRRNFPKLNRVRALSRVMLNDLNEANGPSEENGGYDRWNKWWHGCASQGVRLEDCTGQMLGTLPEDAEEPSSSEEEEEDEEEDEEESEEEGDGEDEEGYDSDYYELGSGEEELEFPMPTGRTTELARLLDEVRMMNAGRDEAMIARVRPELPENKLSK